MDDTLLGYQQLAFSPPSLAKPLVAVTLSRQNHNPGVDSSFDPLGAIRPEGNNNNDVGVPLTVLGATEADAALVIEMGMYRGRSSVSPAAPSRILR